jgi:hypothetical protein
MPYWRAQRGHPQSTMVRGISWSIATFLIIVATLKLVGSA